MIRLAVALTPLVLFGACSHAPRVAGEPEGPVAPADAHDRARDHARVPDLSVARPRDDEPESDEADSLEATDEPGVTNEPGAMNEPGADAQRGRASFYGSGFKGRRTASGARYDSHALTA